MRKSKKVDPLPIFYPPEDTYEEVLSLEIYGHPPRKSNSRRIVTNRRTSKPMIIKSEEALSYSDAFLQQVPAELQLGLGGPKDPLLMMATVYYRSNQADLSVELIKDLLQKAGVIRDDRYVKSEVLFGRVDKNNPRTLITIFRLK